MTLQLYYAPAPGHVYTMGMDSSRGGGRDASALVVLDATLGPVAEAACFRDTGSDGDDLATLARRLHDYGYTVARGNAYNQRPGGLVPEIADPLLAKSLGRFFSHDYWYIQETGATPNRPEGRAVRYGFWTTADSKTAIISNLRLALITRAVRFSNPWLRDEARYWEKFEGDWKFGLQSGHAMGHGDVTMGFALALAGVEAVQDRMVVARRRRATPPLETLVYADLSNPICATPAGEPFGKLRTARRVAV